MNTQFDLSLIKCFQVVAVRGSISGASSELHLSQPAISQQIKRLEEQLGKDLFHRTNRGLNLTSFGRTFLVKARKISEISDEIRELLHSDGRPPTGTIEVGTYSTISSYLIASPVTRFIKEYPGVKISYAYNPVQAMLAKLRSGEIDLAVLSDLPSNVAHLEVTSLFRDELVFAVSKEMDIPDSIPPERLAGLNLISYSDTHDLCYQAVERRFGRFISRMKVTAETTSFDTIKQMVLHGAGSAFIPRYLIQSELEKGQLKVIEIGKVKLPVHFSIVMPPKESASPGAQALKAALQKWFT